MNAARMAELRRRVVLLVGQARNGTRELGGRIDRIWANTERLTIDARRTDVAAAIAQGAVEIRGNLATARGALLLGNAEVDGILDNLRHVPDEVRARKAQILTPILSGRWNGPRRSKPRTADASGIWRTGGSSRTRPRS